MKIQVFVVSALCCALSISTVMADKLPTETGLRQKGFGDLQIAARAGDIVKIKKALQNEQDVNRMVGPYEFETSALYQAVQFRRGAAVKYLLEHHANPNLCGWKSMSPLQVAAEKGYPVIADQLIKAGAYINYRSSPRHGNYTALTLAIKNNHNDIVQKLLNAGADANETTFHGLTPLHVAAKAGNVKAAELLLAHRADINRLDRMGRTATKLASVDGHEDVAKYLRSHEE